MVMLMGTWRLVSSWYGGKPIARLPFHPPGFMTKWVPHLVGLGGPHHTPLPHSTWEDV
jgi:hypothetical protein